MKIQTTIQKWGNSLAIRITGPLKSIPHFTENMLVVIEVNENGLTVQPLTKKRKLHPFKEAQLLDGLTAKTAHADELAIIQNGEFEDYE